MATRRKKPAALDPAAPAAQDPAAPATLDPANEPVGAALAAAQDLQDPTTYDQALRELGIDVPVAACRLVGNRLEFRLYGGRVLYWPPAAGNQPPAAPKTKKGK